MPTTDITGELKPDSSVPGHEFSCSAGSVPAWLASSVI